MRLKKCGDRLFALDGLGVEVGDGTEIEIELIDAKGNEKLRVNGEVFDMKGGRARVASDLFGACLNEVKIYSGGAWFVMEGLVRKDGCLTLDEGYAAVGLSAAMMAIHGLEADIHRLSERVEGLERLCSGDEFL